MINYKEVISCSESDLNIIKNKYNENMYNEHFNVKYYQYLLKNYNEEIEQEIIDEIEYKEQISDIKDFFIENKEYQNVNNAWENIIYFLKNNDYEGLKEYILTQIKFESEVLRVKTAIKLHKLLWELKDREDLNKMVYFAFRNSEEYQFICGKILFYILNYDDIIIDDMIKYNYVTLTRLKWKEKFEKLHIYAKNNSILYYNMEDVTSKRNIYMYIQTIVGKMDIKVDSHEQAALKIRSYIPKYYYKDGKWEQMTYKHMFKKEIKNMFNEAIKKKDTPRYVNIYDFWNQRFEIIAPGSTHYKDYINDKIKNNNTNIKYDKFMINKRAFFNEITLDELIKEIKIKKSLYVKESTKLEVGKTGRSIMAVDDITYIIATFAMGDYDYIFNNFDDMSITNDCKAYMNIIKKIELSKQEWFLSYDYNDFNNQHNLYELIYIAKAFKDRLKELHYCNDSKEYFLNKYIEIMNNIIFKAQAGFKYKARSGLLSGTRFTTRDNTILNHIYMKLADKITQKIMEEKNLDYEKNDIRFLMGDDCIESAKTRSQCVIKTLVLNSMGLTGKIKKQIITKNRCEFLRIIIDKENHILQTNLNRAIAGFVSGNWQSKIDINILNRITSIIDEHWLMIRRGAIEERMNIITDCIINDCLRYENSEGKRVNIDKRLLSVDVRNNGLGIELNKGIIKLNKNLPEIKIDFSDIRNHNIPIIDDYIKTINYDHYIKNRIKNNLKLDYCIQFENKMAMRIKDELYKHYIKINKILHEELDINQNYKIIYTKSSNIKEISLINYKLYKEKRTKSNGLIKQNLLNKMKLHRMIFIKESNYLNTVTTLISEVLLIQKMNKWKWINKIPNQLRQIIDSEICYDYKDYNDILRTINKYNNGEKTIKLIDYINNW